MRWYLGVREARHHHRHMGIIDGLGRGCATQARWFSRVVTVRCDAMQCSAKPSDAMGCDAQGGLRRGRLGSP